MVRSGRGFRSALVSAVFALAVASLFAGGPARAAQAPGDPQGRMLVLPLQAVGVDDNTALVSRNLLMGSLQDLGVAVVPADTSKPPLPSGAAACVEPNCAAELAKQYGASRVAYGSLSRLGGKIIARISVLRLEEAAPYYRDQLTATYEDDLDTVMRRFAEGISAGKPNSDQASVESVTQAETLTPALRATRSGFGFRAGFLFPTNNSFGGADRLTNLHGAYKYEMKKFMIETTPILGFTFGDDNFDWTILDLSAARIFGTRDFSGFLGGTLGVHSVTVARTHTFQDPYYPFEISATQTETAPTADIIAGIIAMRTFDFEMILEVRYHYVFENFDKVSGNGANGVQVTIGTSR